MKRFLALALVLSLVFTLFGGQIVWAEETTVTVVADNDSAGNPTWQSATLTTTATEGTYIVKNNDEGAGYSFTWTPANNTIALDGNSAATASEVVVPSEIDGVKVLTTGSKFIKQASPDILTSVIISEGITTLGESAFNGYKMLENVKLPTTLVTIKRAAFASCSALKTVVIPESVTGIGDTIFKSSGIVDIVIPANVKNPIQGEAFANCKSLKNITFMGEISGFGWGSFTGDAALETMTFMGKTALKSIYSGALTNSSSNLIVYYPEDGTGYDTYEFRSMFIAGTVFRVIGKEPVFDPPVGTVEAAEVVADNDVTGNPSWQSATTTVTDKEGIYILTNVSQGYSFKWLPDIKTIMLDADSAGAENVVIPSKVNGIDVITVADKIIPKADPEVLKTVVFSEGITSAGNSVLAGHTLLETIILPTTIRTIGETAFNGCKNLRNIKLPEGLKSIGYQSFKNTAITELTFPSTYDNNIQGDMFSGCKSLKKVVFKGYLKTINWSTFHNNSSLEELVFLDTTPPSSIDKSAFTGVPSTLVVYYPEGAVAYEDATFQAKFPEGTTFAVYPSNYAEVKKAINNNGTYELEYEIRVSEDNSDAMVLIALYNDNTLVNCKTVSTSSAATTITGDFDADQIKLFLWESTESIMPLCSAAVAKIEPAAPRGRVYNSNGTVVTDNGDLLRGVFVETDYATSVVSYSQLEEIKNYGCNTVHLYAERPSAKLAAGYRLDMVDQYVEMTEKLGLYLILTVGDSTLNKEFDLAFWEIYAPRYKDKTHVIYEVQNESNGFSPPTEQYLADLKEVHDRIRELAPDTHTLLFSFSHLRSVEDIDAYIAAMGLDDWSKTAVAWHGYDSNPPDYAAFVKHLRDNGYASINTELPTDINGYANEILLRTMEELGCSWNHFVNVGNIKNDKYWTIPIEKGGISWDSDFGMWPELGVKSAHQFTPATDYDNAADVGIQGEYAVSDADGGYIAFDKYNFATAPVLFDAYVSEDSSGSIALYLDSLTTEPVATLEVSGGRELYTCQVPEITGKHTLYLVFTGDISLKQFRFVDQPVNPYETIQAENYTEQQGVDRGSGDGGMVINAIQENDYIAFDNVDFGAGATSCDIRISSVYTISKAQLRIDSLDGPVIGEIELPITGGWDKYQTYSGLVSGVEGRHKLYVIFVEGSHGGGYCNINWLRFNQ